VLQQRTFPEVAAVLRSQHDAILRAWTEAVASTIPAARNLKDEELEDHVPVILHRLADALASASPDETLKLAEVSPLQGITRFRQNYDVQAVMTEDRLLRKVVIEHTEVALGRPLILPEHLALNMGLDLMLQASVVAFVNRQNERLREAAETEVRYLSFLSHDMNNHLSSVSLWLNILRQRLADAPHALEDVEAVDHAQRAIQSTVAGMRRLLESERLRRRRPR